jgi:hypothetical protein
MLKTFVTGELVGMTASHYVTKSNGQTLTWNKNYYLLSQEISPKVFKYSKQELEAVLEKENIIKQIYLGKED